MQRAGFPKRNVSTAELRRKPDHVSALQQLGFLVHQGGHIDAAAELLDKACRLAPAAAEGHYNLGVVLMDQGKLSRAAEAFRRALAINPDLIEGHNNLGIVLAAQHKPVEAIACYERVLALRPDFAEGHNNIGAALSDIGKLDAAIAHYQRALSLVPKYADAHNNLGNALKAQGNGKEALASYDRALAVRPDYTDALVNRGAALLSLGRHDEAAASFERVIALKPDHGGAKLALCIAQLPILYRNQNQIAERRSAYRRNLEMLSDDVSRGSPGTALAEMIGSCQPFYLAYQGQNDRDLQQLYGSLMCRLMADHYGPAKLARPPRRNEAIRVGIVSGFFRSHSNWKFGSGDGSANLTGGVFRSWVTTPVASSTKKPTLLARLVAASSRVPCRLRSGGRPSRSIPPTC